MTERIPKSKRRGVKRTWRPPAYCSRTSKLMFDSRRDAIAQMSRTQPKQGRLSAYRCPFCQHWHMTHQEKRKRMQNHYLKTWPEYYDLVAADLKWFELRKDDRGFEVGDIVHLVRYDPETKLHTGELKTRRIAYILRNAPQFGLMNGYCILQLEEVE